MCVCVHALSYKRERSPTSGFTGPSKPWQPPSFQNVSPSDNHRKELLPGTNELHICILFNCVHMCVCSFQENTLVQTTSNVGEEKVVVGERDLDENYGGGGDKS